jgi:hypothetical protein
MVGLAVGLPHLMKTHADESASTAQTTSQANAPSASQAPSMADLPSSQPWTSEAVGTSTATTTPAGDAMAGPSGTDRSADQMPGMSMKAGQRAMEKSSAKRPGASGPMASMKQPASPAMAPAGGDQPGEANASAPIVRTDNTAAQLEAAENRFTDLSARAGAVDGSLNSLRQQQEASGYGLRGDMAAADNRLQSYLRAADQDLRSSNATSANKNLTRAEAELATLEKFLGR